MQNSKEQTVGDLIKLLHSKVDELGKPSAVVVSDESTGIEYIFAFYLNNRTPPQKLQQPPTLWSEDK